MEISHLFHRTRDPRLDDLVRRLLVDEGAAPSAVVAWGRREAGNSAWNVRIGAAGVGDDAIFDLASVTKPLTALAAARLVADGKLAFTTRVGDVLPFVSDLPAAAARLDALLSHRAGMPAWGALYRRDPWNATTAYSMGPDEPAPSLETLLRRAASRVEPPKDGDPSVYSDLGLILVGAMVAKIAGEPLAARWEAICGASSASRWKARDASFVERAVPNEDVPWRGGVVRGEVHDENAWALERAGGDPGHAGAFATIDQLVGVAVRFVAALEGEGDLLPRAIAERMIAPIPNGSHRTGWDSPSPGGSQSGTRFGPRAFGHLGFTGTSIWVDPDAHAIAVLLTNRSHPSRDNQRIRVVRPKLHDALWEL